ncbi:unnamed protein product, partial [Owenia fusiformis]
AATTTSESEFSSVPPSPLVSDREEISFEISKVKTEETILLEPVPSETITEELHGVEVELDITSIESSIRSSPEPEQPVEEPEQPVEEPVLEAPVFTEKLVHKDVIEGFPATMECFVKGTPEPEITWYQ